MWIRYGAQFRRWALAGTVTVATFLVLVSIADGTVRPVNAGLVLLLLTLLISASFGFWTGLAAALLSNVILVYFFLAPIHRFWASHPQELASLAVFLLASAIGASLLETSRMFADQARKGQAQSEVLLSLNRAIMGQIDPHTTLRVICCEVVSAFAARRAAVLVSEGGAWTVIASSELERAARPASDEEAAIAERAISAGTSAQPGSMSPNTGRRLRGSATSAGTASIPAIFAPLDAAGRSLGVLRIDGPFNETSFRENPGPVIMAFAREAALAISRLELMHAASQAEALRQADEMKTAILSSISHDLKTPLATIKTSASSLLEVSVAWTESDRVAFLESISEEADQLDRTISNLLDLNRLESGAVKPILEEESISQIVEDAIELKADFLQDRRIHTDVPDLSLRTDASLLTQALANLIENAAMHSRRGGAIRVDATLDGQSLEVSVQDEGPGIAADELPFVFNPYYKARGGRAAPNGSGLGLSIVRGFVTLCGGTVGAESTHNYSRFVIRLPLSQPTTIPELT